MSLFRLPAALSFTKPVLASSILLTLLLSACADKAAPPPQAATPPALPVTVLEMKPVNLPAVIEVMAQTEGARETEVRARVGGILLKRLYEEGMPVKAGQPLFQIDPAPYENALAEAKARAEQAAREEARLKGLVAQQAVSRMEYDNAVSVNAMAQAALKQAQLNLSWTTVTAPVSGTSNRAARSEGNLISVSDPVALTSIAQTNPMWVRFGVSDAESAKLPGHQLKAKNVSGVELMLANGSVYPKPGKINFLASTIDTVLGTQQLRAEFDNSEGQLLPGQFVRVRVMTGMREGVFLVPQSAVVQTEQANLVMTADAENKVAPRPIQTAEWQGRDWVVTGGLKAGDRVIVDNLMKLRPGMVIAPQAPQAAPAAAAAGNPAPEKSAESRPKS